MLRPRETPYPKLFALMLFLIMEKLKEVEAKEEDEEKDLKTRKLAQKNTRQGGLTQIWLQIKATKV